jgi:DNA-directed RNA polymerase subunit RPC12/RpoP
MGEIDTDYTDEIVCPHCGYEYSDSWEFDGYSDTIECSSCGEGFEYTRDVSVTYSTQKVLAQVK